MAYKKLSLIYIIALCISSSCYAMQKNKQNKKTVTFQASVHTIQNQTVPSQLEERIIVAGTSCSDDESVYENVLLEYDRLGKAAEEHINTKYKDSVETREKLKKAIREDIKNGKQFTKSLKEMSESLQEMDELLDNSLQEVDQLLQSDKEELKEESHGSLQDIQKLTEIATKIDAKIANLNRLRFLTGGLLFAGTVFLSIACAKAIGII